MTAPRLALLSALIALGGTAPALAATAPRAGIDSFAELRTPLPYPYDEQADADAVVAKALRTAKARRKLLLLDLGGNWCGDCRILAATLELPAVKAFVERHYVLASVDVGRFDRNLQVPARYGFTRRLEGVPTLLVIDPATNRVINRQDVFALSSAGSMSPQALADWLARWPR